MTSNSQKIKHCLLAIFLTSIFFAIPFTAFQYLDLQYRITHTNPLQYATQPWTDPTDQSVIMNYGYRLTPWDRAMHISMNVFVVIPALVTVFASVFYLYSSQGSLKNRYTTATYLAIAFIPIFYFSNLPWGFIYWNGWEWYGGLLAILIYGSLIVVCAGILNAIMTIVLYRREQKNLG